LTRGCSRNHFSKEQNEIYDCFFRYFSFIEKRYHLKKDFSRRYDFLKTREPCDFQTDEKLLAAALTLAFKEDSILVSSDTDLFTMISFFYKKPPHKNEFDLQKPPHVISLYSDFGEGFELMFTSSTS
jgi:hypothetical protein